MRLKNKNWKASLLKSLIFTPLARLEPGDGKTGLNQAERPPLKTDTLSLQANPSLDRSRGGKGAAKRTDASKKLSGLHKKERRLRKAWGVSKEGKESEEGGPSRISP